jgi:hypothetical protein
MMTGLVPSSSELTPRQRIAAECARRGQRAVVTGCVDLLSGRHEAVDDALVVALGGLSAQYVLGGGEGGRAGYWPRVWAARGLLHQWDDTAAPAIIAAAEDPAWRVREMAAKVVARHHVGEAFAAAVALRDDQVPRVRAAAERAVAALTASRS